MNHANPHSVPLVPHQPSRAAPASSLQDDPSPDLRELTPGELLAVAGGPMINNGA